MKIWKSASAIHEDRWGMINIVCSLLGVFSQYMNTDGCKIVPCVLNDYQQQN